MNYKVLLLSNVSPFSFVCVCACMCVCVCVCVCVCLRPFIVKALSVWISWNAKEQINDVMLSYAKPYRYFRMKHQKPFLLATLACSHTKIGLSQDLNCLRIALKNI